MLHILSQPFFTSAATASAKCSNSQAPGSSMAMTLDERATLTNMAVEAGGFTGVIEADEVVVDYIHEIRGTDKDSIRARLAFAHRRCRRRSRVLSPPSKIDLATRSSRWSRPLAIRATACPSRSS